MLDVEVRELAPDEQPPTFAPPVAIAVPRFASAGELRTPAGSTPTRTIELLAAPAAGDRLVFTGFKTVKADEFKNLLDELFGVYGMMRESHG